MHRLDRMGCGSVRDHRLDLGGRTADRGERDHLRRATGEPLDFIGLAPSRGRQSAQAILYRNIVTLPTYQLRATDM